MANKEKTNANVAESKTEELNKQEQVAVIEANKGETTVEQVETNGRKPWSTKKKAIVGGGIAAVVATVIAVIFGAKRKSDDEDYYEESEESSED